MKKTVCILLALLLGASLCACDSADPADTSVADTFTPDTQSESEMTASDTDPSSTPESTPSTESDTTSDTAPQANPTFSADRAIAALDELARDGISVNIDYKTVNAGGMEENHRGGFNQKNGQYRHNVYEDGNALVVDGDYYHYYTLESSKWTYVTTYAMAEAELYNEVVNARYWWKNHLDSLGFTAYDKLECTGTETVMETLCHVFTVADNETDVGRVTVTLYADATTGNVLKVETAVQHSDTVFTDTVVETVMELLYIKTGDEVTTKKLPDPKGWERPE